MLRWCRAWYTVCNNAGWNRMLYGCTHAVFMADEEMIWRAYKELLWFEMESVLCPQMSFSGTMCLLFDF